MEIRERRISGRYVCVHVHIYVGALRKRCAGQFHRTHREAVTAARPLLRTAAHTLMPSISGKHNSFISGYSGVNFFKVDRTESFVAHAYIATIERERVSVYTGFLSSRRRQALRIRICICVCVSAPISQFMTEILCFFFFFFFIFQMYGGREIRRTFGTDRKQFDRMERGLEKNKSFPSFIYSR